MKSIAYRAKPMLFERNYNKLCLDKEFQIQIASSYVNKKIDPYLSP